MEDGKISNIICSLLKRIVKQEKISEVTVDWIIERIVSMTHIRLDRENLKQIPVLDFLHNATNVYLQENCISKIENLSFITSIKFLTLSGNRISVIEGLKTLKSLGFLDLSHNCVKDVDAEELPKSLIILNLEGNPCTEKAQYQSHVTSHLPYLRSLDGSPVEHDSLDEDDESSGGSDTEVDESTKEKSSSNVLLQNRVLNEKEQIERRKLESLKSEIEKTFKIFSSTLKESELEVMADFTKLNLEYDIGEVSMERTDSQMSEILKDSDQLFLTERSPRTPTPSKITPTVSPKQKSNIERGRKIRTPGARPIKRVAR